MKKLLLGSVLFLAFTAGAQESDEIRPATKGVVYGVAPAEATAIKADEIQAKLVNGVFDGQVTGKVKEVCQTMGCWMKIEKADGTTLMVKTKDHKFFMPKDIVGHTVLLEGSAIIKEESEAKQKHYAEDAGKSKKEIAKIKGTKTELQFVATGVKVIE